MKYIFAAVFFILFSNGYAFAERTFDETNSTCVGPVCLTQTQDEKQRALTFVYSGALHGQLQLGVVIASKLEGVHELHVEERAGILQTHVLLARDVVGEIEVFIFNDHQPTEYDSNDGRNYHFILK